MTQQNPSFPERMDRLAKRLMGFQPMRDPRKEEKPIFATFQDRVMASVMDAAFIYLLFQSVFRFITAKVFAHADMARIEAAFAQRPQDATIPQAILHQLNAALESGLFELWVVNSFLQSVLVGIVLVMIWREFHFTPGKYILGLEYAGKKGEGKPSLKRYIVRYLGFYISMPVFMIGFAVLGLDKQKRAIHDRIAGTTVIYSKRGSVFRQAWDVIKSLAKRLRR